MPVQPLLCCCNDTMLALAFLSTSSPKKEGIPRSPLACVQLHQSKQKIETQRNKTTPRTKPRMTLSGHPLSHNLYTMPHTPTGASADAGQRRLRDRKKRGRLGGADDDRPRSVRPTTLSAAPGYLNARHQANDYVHRYVLVIMPVGWAGLVGCCGRGKGAKADDDLLS